MFMLFFISVAPFFDILSCEFFRSVRNFFAVLFGKFDFWMAAKAFCRRGSVGLVARICFADDLVGWRRYAFIPALHTFSAPCILIDLMSDKSSLKLELFTFFFI